MPKDIYRKLARHLDKLPGGYPPTESGVELRILRRLFTEDEAALAMKCTLIPEDAKVIARRAKLETAEAARRLDDLALKGLIFRFEYNGSALYMAAQYVVGIWEYHVNDLDPELIKEMNEYIPYLFDHENWKKAPQLRTIPVGRSVSAEQAVMPYEQAEELVRRHKKILVAPCICRREHAMLGHGCGKLEEACLVFGIGVDYYENNGLGRRIDVDEALAILKKADKEGLVLQPTNAKKVVNICCCCGCCCQVLKSLKRHPRPAELAASAFIAAFDPENCASCGICVERCQMDAITMKDKELQLNLDRCIGCGLCVSTCPTDSLTLERKPEAQQPHVPKNNMEALLNLGKARGSITPASMVMMKLKSKADRLLAKS